MKRSYYITGVAGTGKSTVAKELQKHGFEVYDIDYVDGLCHYRNKETKEQAQYTTGVGKDWLDAHEWICDEEKLKELLNKNPQKNTVVVGMAANQESFFHLFDKVFLLYCSEETFIKRIHMRSESNFGKDTSEQEQLLSWYNNFQERLKNVGAIPINTEASLNEIVDKIRNSLT